MNTELVCLPLWQKSMPSYFLSGRRGRFERCMLQEALLNAEDEPLIAL